MKASLSTNVFQSAGLAKKLKGWLPLLQANINDLETIISDAKNDNPFLEVQSGFETKDEKLKKNIYEPQYRKYSSQETIEKLTVDKESLYDALKKQIDTKLFPTPISQNIAFEIIEDINEDGYFDGNIEDIAKRLEVSSSIVESVRKRFTYLEPYGIGAIDYKESFLFQLEHMELDKNPEIYDLCSIIIKDLDNVHKYQKHTNYQEAMGIIKKFRNPPRMEYNNIDEVIIPDVMIFVDEKGDILVSLNNSYYPTLHLDVGQCDKNNKFVKEKLKEGNDVIHALNMRKSTLKKVADLIAANQYEFFIGGDIKPMKLKDIAVDLEYNPSTISRTIADKYLICNRGIFSIKSFFTTSLDSESDLSNASIKSFIDELVKSEDRQKPYSDEKIRQKIIEKFNIDIVRRTITKYRKQLNIGSSTERKKYLHI